MQPVHMYSLGVQGSVCSARLSWGGLRALGCVLHCAGDCMNCCTSRPETGLLRHFHPLKIEWTRCVSVLRHACSMVSTCLGGHADHHSEARQVVVGMLLVKALLQLGPHTPPICAGCPHSSRSPTRPKRPTAVHKPMQPGMMVPCASDRHAKSHSATALGNSTGCRLLLPQPLHSPPTGLPVRLQFDGHDIGPRQSYQQGLENVLPMRPSYKPTPAAWMPQSTLCLCPPGRALKRLMYSWSTVSSAKPLAMPPSSCTPHHGDEHTLR